MWNVLFDINGADSFKKNLQVSSFSTLMECLRLVSDEQFCGGRMTKAQGEIKTPNWPDKKYEPGTSCSWLITVEPNMVSGKLTHSVQPLYSPSSLLWLIESLYLCLFGYQVIHVNFDKFAVEDDAYCRFDYVAFFNGGERDDSRLIGKYCGDQVPEWVTEISEAFKVVLK